MRLYRLLLTASFSIAFLVTYATNEPFSYVNPVPSSALHKAQTGIILRTVDQIDPSTITRKGLFSVFGSLSKGHPATVRLSEDGKSILLQPASPFVPGDSVVVTVAKGIKTLTGKKVTNIKFFFKITPALTQPQKQQIKDAQKRAWDEDFGTNQKHSAPVTDIESKWTKGLPPFYIWTNTPNATPGDIFFSNFNFEDQPTSHYCIIDNSGDSVYGKYDTQNYNNFDLNHNLNLSLYDAVDSFWIELDSNYRSIDTFRMGNGYQADVHEFQLLPNKYCWMLCYDAEPVDMSKVVAGGQKNATPLGCVIQQIDDSGRVIFEWRSWDHYSLTDATHEPLTTVEPDLVHGNSIAVDNDGNILFSSRHMEEVTKIDVNTGNIIWRWGGKNNQFKFINDSLGFSYQHDVRRIANGHITIFDNGNFHIPSQTWVKEYSVDETAKTATLVWSYHRFSPVNVHGFCRAMGSVQRLSNGHTFIDWGLIGSGAYPSATEIDSLGNIVWEMRLDSEYDDGMYRAHKYNWTPCSRVSYSTMSVSKITNTSAKLAWQPATNAVSYTAEVRPKGTTTFMYQTVTKTNVKIQNLTPGTTYEWGVSSSCDSTTLSNYTALATFTTSNFREMEANASAIAATIFPNPSHGEFSLQINLPENNLTSIRIFNASNETVYQSTLNLEAGLNNATIDLSKEAPGVYFCQVQSGSNRIVRKIVIE